MVSENSYNFNELCYEKGSRFLFMSYPSKIVQALLNSLLLFEIFRLAQ